MTDDKVYVITGASSGIGVGIAECLVKSGIKNLVLVARRKDKLEEVANNCKSLGAAEVLVLQKDLSNLDMCPEIVTETINKFGSMTYVITYLWQINQNFK